MSECLTVWVFDCLTVWHSDWPTKCLTYWQFDCLSVLGSDFLTAWLYKYIYISSYSFPVRQSWYKKAEFLFWPHDESPVCTNMSDINRQFSFWNSQPINNLIYLSSLVEVLAINLSKTVWLQWVLWPSSRFTVWLSDHSGRRGHGHQLGGASRRGCWRRGGVTPRVWGGQFTLL